MASAPRQTQTVTPAELARAHKTAIAGPGSVLGTARTVPPKNTLDPSLLPWDFQPWENLRSYRAFEVYLALSLGRSVSAVEKAISKKGKEGAIKNSPSSCGTLNAWCRDNLWTIRARAWDCHLADIRRRTQESEVETMNSVQARNHVRMQEIAATNIEHLAALPPPVTWKEADSIIKLMIEGAKGERIARGLGLEPSGGGVTQNFNLSGLDTNELDVFIRLHSKVSTYSPPALDDPDSEDVIEG